MLRTLCVALVALTFFLPVEAEASLRSEVEALAGSGAVVWVMDEQDEVLLQVGGNKSFIPASTLKIFTALLAAEHMDLTSRFKTEFFVDGDRLIVRGGGDPFLVSEELDLVAQALKKSLGDRSLSGVFVDDSFFEEGIEVPGTSGSEKPYDALNSATAVNFNTINVERVDGKIRSGEAQTPLTPLAEEVALKNRIGKKDRINISNDPAGVQRYVSELVAAKLRLAGVEVGEAYGVAEAPQGEPTYVHENSKTLSEVCSLLLYYSTNYVANQVYLAIGAAVHGTPASLEKSRRVSDAYLAAHPELEGMTVVEGSGLSYQNRATAKAMLALLKLFEPHKDMLRQKHDTPNKTGTLKVTKSVVGYQDTASNGTVRFVIILDGKGYYTRWKVLDLIRKHL